MIENWEIVLTAAFSAIGVMEWAKGFFPDVNKKVWRGLMPLVCLGVVFAAQRLPDFVTLSLVTLASTQVGYEAIVEGVISKFKGMGSE